MFGFSLRLLVWILLYLGEDSNPGFLDQVPTSVEKVTFNVLLRVSVIPKAGSALKAKFTSRNSARILKLGGPTFLLFCLCRSIEPFQLSGVPAASGPQCAGWFPLLNLCGKGGLGFRGYVRKQNCKTLHRRFTYGGEEFCTDTVDGATNLGRLQFYVFVYAVS